MLWWLRSWGLIWTGQSWFMFSWFFKTVLIVVKSEIHRIIVVNVTVFTKFQDSLTMDDEAWPFDQARLLLSLSIQLSWVLVYFPRLRVVCPFAHRSCSSRWPRRGSKSQSFRRAPPVKRVKLWAHQLVTDAGRTHQRSSTWVGLRSESKAKRKNKVDSLRGLS